MAEALERSLKQVGRSQNEALHRQIAGVLSRHIEAGAAPGTRLPSERQLCSLTGASRSTVRVALDSLLHAGYIEKRHGKGMFVRPRTVRCIGCVFPDIDQRSRYQWPVVLSDGIAAEALSQECESRRYLLSSEADFERLRADALSGRVDGILTMRPLGPIEELVPTVHAYSEAEGYLVFIDYDSLIRQAADAVLRAGRKSPVLVNYGGTSLAAHSALAGYRRALVAHGLASAERCIAPTRSAEEAGAEAVRELLREPTWDSIIFIDDFNALGGTRELAAAGVEVPGQVMVATHVNKGYNLPYPVPVLRVQVDPRAIARQMISVLQGIWRGEEPPRVSYVAPALRAEDGSP